MNIHPGSRVTSTPIIYIDILYLQHNVTYTKNFREPNKNYPTKLGKVWENFCPQKRPRPHLGRRRRWVQRDPRPGGQRGGTTEPARLGIGGGHRYRCAGGVGWKQQNGVCVWNKKLLLLLLLNLVTQPTISTKILKEFVGGLHLAPFACVLWNKCDRPGGWFHVGGGFYHEHELQRIDKRWQLDEMSLNHLTMRLL